MDSVQSKYFNNQIQDVSQIFGIKSRSSTSSLVQNEQDKPAFDVQLSSLGTILSSVKDSGSAESSEVKSFFDQLITSINSGDSIDATALAESSPEWLKEAAEETGVDLTSALQEFIDNAPTDAGMRAGMGRPPQGPPPEMMDTQLGQLLQSAEESGTTDEDGISSFLDTLKEAIDSGSVDTASLAENAPDWLKASADESGLNLEDVLNEFISNLQSSLQSSASGKITE
jgi:hypothetical protein